MQKLRRIIFVFILVVFPLLSVAEEGAGWKVVATDSFSLEVPDDFYHKILRGIDSQVGKFENSSLSIEYDLGSWSSPLTNNFSAKHYSKEDLIVAGKRAWLVTYAISDKPACIYSGLHIPKLNDSHEQNTKLTIGGISCSEADHSLIKRILKSVQFK